MKNQKPKQKAKELVVAGPFAFLILVASDLIATQVVIATVARFLA